MGKADFSVGDRVKVSFVVTEDRKSRSAPFEGIVISLRGEENNKTFTVRKIGNDAVAVERIFPLSSPSIKKVEILKRNKVRRSKLYYLRKKGGGRTKFST